MISKSSRAQSERARPGRYYHHTYFYCQTVLPCSGLKGMVAAIVTGTRDMTPLSLGWQCICDATTDHVLSNEMCILRSTEPVALAEFVTLMIKPRWPKKKMATFGGGLCPTVDVFPLK